MPKAIDPTMEGTSALPGDTAISSGSSEKLLDADADHTEFNLPDYEAALQFLTGDD